MSTQPCHVSMRTERASVLAACAEVSRCCELYAALEVSLDQALAVARGGVE